MNKILNNIKELVKNCDYVLIGAGSGLSTASGIDYGGAEFKSNFKPFIEKYGFTDLYTSSFYYFPDEQHKWAYWAKHINFANTGRAGMELYRKIYELVKDKEYFVITTNVDDQFYKTGFDEDKIYRVQGSYRFIQCSYACHNKLYDDKEMVAQMLSNIDNDLKVPQNLVPICPVCGENMDVNLRKDEYFVQDDLWYKQANAYREFLEKEKDKKVALLEFGVGFNTPTIIRIPFEQMIVRNKNWTLIRFNKDTKSFFDLDERFIEVREDINEIFKDVKA